MLSGNGRGIKKEGFFREREIEEKTKLTHHARTHTEILIPDFIPHDSFAVITDTNGTQLVALMTCQGGNRTGVSASNGSDVNEFGPDEYVAPFFTFPTADRGYRALAEWEYCVVSRRQ